MCTFPARFCGRSCFLIRLPTVGISERSRRVLGTVWAKVGALPTTVKWCAPESCRSIICGTVVSSTVMCGPHPLDGSVVDDDDPLLVHDSASFRRDEELVVGTAHPPADGV